MPRWQVMDHTADVGLITEGPTLEAALEALIEGYGHLVCPDGQVEAAEQATLAVEAERLDDLVIDLLDEVNFLHQMEGFIPARARIELGQDPLTVTATMEGEAWDSDRHGYLMEIKATTYHGLEVEAGHGDEPATVRVIFDI